MKFVLLLTLALIQTGENPERYTSFVVYDGATYDSMEVCNASKESEIVRIEATYNMLRSRLLSQAKIEGISGRCIGYDPEDGFPFMANPEAD